MRRLDDEVDLVVSGHAHSFTNALVENANGVPILVTQAFSASTAYGDIDLAIDPRSGDIVQKSARILTTWADAGPGLSPDPEVAADRTIYPQAEDLANAEFQEDVGDAATLIYQRYWDQLKAGR